MEFFHPLNLNQYSDILIIFKLYHNHHIGHFETIIILNHPNHHHAPPPKKKHQQKESIYRSETNIVKPNLINLFKAIYGVY